MKQFVIVGIAGLALGTVTGLCWLAGDMETLITVVAVSLVPLPGLALAAICRRRRALAYSLMFGWALFWLGPIAVQLFVFGSPEGEDILAFIGATGTAATFGSLLAFVIGDVRAVRRQRHIKRRLCPACAYPVGESGVCTECGKPVTPRRGAGV